MSYQIDPLPSPLPDRSQGQTEFESACTNFFGALPTFQSQANAFAVGLDNLAETVEVFDAVANVTKWVSGTTYAEGVCVWSPTTHYTYRRKVSGAGTTDPGSDSANWEVLSVPEVATTTKNGLMSSTDKTKLDGVPSSGIAILSSTQTWTGAQTFDGGLVVADYVQETPTTANTSTAYAVNIASGTLFNLTLTGNCTFTFPTATAGRQFTLLLKQDATGSRTITWPSSVRWANGAAPTITATASQTDVISFVADGTYWLGFVGGQNFTRA